MIAGLAALAVVSGCGSQPGQVSGGGASSSASQPVSQPPPAASPQPSQPVIGQSCYVWRKMVQELPGDYARKYTATLINNSDQQMTVDSLTVDLTGADGSVMATLENASPGGGAYGLILPPGSKGKTTAGFDSTDISGGSGNSADVAGCTVVSVYTQNPANPSGPDIEVIPGG
jgi:hypothetical protein